jgi:hypothetical protein
VTIGPDTLAAIVASMFAAAVGGYVAVRADLAGLRAKVERAEDDIKTLFGLRANKR